MGARMLSPYVDVLRQPGAAAFSITGLVARLPIAMVGLGIVLLVTSTGGSYALAGGLSATFALAGAFVGPFTARLIDRLGQHRVLLPLAILHATGLIGLIVGVERQWPAGGLFALAALTGALMPSIGSLVRARWALLLTGTPRLRTAFALESVLDEVLFILGPPLATVLALQVAPPAALIAAAGLVTVGSAALSIQRRTEPPPVLAHHQHGGPAALRQPGMATVVAVMVLMGGIFGAFEVSTVAFAARAGVPGATGVLLALYAAGSLIAGVVVGSRSTGASFTRQLGRAAVLLSVVCLPLPFVQSVPLLGLVALAAGLAVSPVLIAAMALVERLVPARRLTEGLTLAVSGIGVGLALSASGAGILIDRFGPSPAYAIVSGAGILALATVAARGRSLAAAERRTAGLASLGNPAASPLDLSGAAPSGSSADLLDRTAAAIAAHPGIDMPEPSMVAWHPAGDQDAGGWSDRSGEQLRTTPAHRPAPPDTAPADPNAAPSQER